MTRWLAKPKGTYPNLWACEEPVSYVTSGWHRLLMRVSTENSEALSIPPWPLALRAKRLLHLDQGLTSMSSWPSSLLCIMLTVRASCWANPKFVRPAFHIWEARSNSSNQGDIWTLLIIDSILTLPVLYLPCPIPHRSPARNSSPHVKPGKPAPGLLSRPSLTQMDLPGTCTCITLAHLSFCCSCLSSDLHPLANHPDTRWYLEWELKTHRPVLLGSYQNSTTKHKAHREKHIPSSETANTAYPLHKNLTPKGKYFC